MTKLLTAFLIVTICISLYLAIPISIKVDDYDTNFWNFKKVETLPLEPEFSSKKVVNVSNTNVVEENVFYTSEMYGNKKIRIHGYLCYPKNIEEKLPAIIILHGFGGSAEDTRIYARRLASKGYVALAIDSPGQGLSTGPKNNQRNFANITNGPYYAYLYRNVIATIRGITFLESLNFVDNSKIGVSGASQGGVTTFLVSALDERVKLSIPVIASGRFDEAAKKGSAVHGIIPKELTANSKEAALLVKYFDPFGYVDKINCPLLMLIGTNDEFFLLELANKTFNMINSNTKFIDLLPNTGHTFKEDWFYSSLKFADWIFKTKEPFPNIELKIIQDNPLEAKIIALSKFNKVILHSKDNLPWSLWKSLEMKYIGYDYGLKMNKFESVIPKGLVGKEVFANVVENGKLISSTQVYLISPSFLLQSLFLTTILGIICLVLYKLAKLSKLKNRRHIFLILYSFAFSLSSLLPFIEIYQRARITIWDIISTYAIRVPILLALSIFVLLILVPLAMTISERLGLIISTIAIIIFWLFYFLIQNVFSKIVIVVPSSCLILMTSSFALMLICAAKRS